MKAIVKVPTASAYAKHNGYTYDVIEFLTYGLALRINGVKTDFTFREVYIVDFKEVYELHFNLNSQLILPTLKKYAEVNDIKID